MKKAKLQLHTSIGLMWCLVGHGDGYPKRELNHLILLTNNQMKVGRLRFYTVNIRVCMGGGGDEYAMLHEVQGLDQFTEHLLH